MVHVKEMSKEELKELKRKMENFEDLLSILSSDEIEYILSNVDKNLIEINSLLEKNYILIGDPNLGIRAIPKNEYEFEIEKDMDSIEENVAKMLNEDLENDLAGFVPPSLEEFGDIAGIALTDRALFKSVYEGLYFTINNSGYKAAKEKDPVTGETYYVFKNEADLIDFCNKVNEIKEKLEAELLENRTNYMAITATGLDILMRYDELYRKFTDNARNKDNIDTNSKVILKSLYDKYTKDIQQELEVTHDYLVTLSFTIRLCKNVIKIAKDEFNSQSEDMKVSE